MSEMTLDEIAAFWKRVEAIERKKGSHFVSHHHPEEGLIRIQAREGVLEELGIEDEAAVSSEQVWAILAENKKVIQAQYTSKGIAHGNA